MSKLVTLFPDTIQLFSDSLSLIVFLGLILARDIKLIIKAIL